MISPKDSCGPGRLRRASDAEFRLLLAIVLSIPLACSAGPTSDSGSPPASPSNAVRLVLVAIDAGDWLAIDPLVASGKLPTFARLRSIGRTGIMAATPPLISPIIWTTIATGQQPEDHGILDFMLDLPDGTQGPVASTQRLTPALWNLFSDAGRRVAFVGWWATWPAEQVRGVMVSDALAPQLARADARIDAGLVSPPDMAARVRAAIVKPAQLTYDDLAAYVPLTRAEFDEMRAAAQRPAGTLYENPLAHLAAVVASTRTYGSLAVELLRAERPDLLAVYIESVDTVSHLFVRDARRGPAALERAYRDADDLLARLAEASPAEALIVVCSDHGFYPPTAAIVEDPANLSGPATAWHRPYGIVGAVSAAALTGRATAGGTDGPRDVGLITPLDIAPTVLHAGGLPVPRDMPGRVIASLLPRDVAAREVRRVAPPRFVPQTATAAGTRDSADAWARLQALGYVGAVKTSLARQNLGESLYRRGKFAQAERELRAVLEAQPSNLGALLWLAKAQAAQQRGPEAVRTYLRAVALPGGARDALAEGVDLALAAGDVPAARRLIDAAGHQPDARPALAVARGALAEAAGDLDGAERQYRAALRSDPQHFDAAARLMDLLIARHRAADALTVVMAAARLAPDSPRHLALVGEARLAAREAAGAEDALRRALQLAPDGESVRISLARAQLMGGKNDAAIATLEAAAPSAPRDTLLGAAYSSAGRWTQAVASFRAVVDRGGPTPEVLNGLGWASMKLGKREESLAAFERSLQLAPDQPDIRKLTATLRSATPAASSR